MAMAMIHPSSTETARVLRAILPTTSLTEKQPEPEEEESEKDDQASWQLVKYSKLDCTAKERRRQQKKTDPKLSPDPVQIISDGGLHTMDVLPGSFLFWLRQEKIGQTREGTRLLQNYKHIEAEIFGHPVLVLDVDVKNDQLTVFKVSTRRKIPHGVHRKEICNLSGLGHTEELGDTKTRCEKLHMKGGVEFCSKGNVPRLSFVDLRDTYKLPTFFFALLWWMDLNSIQLDERAFRYVKAICPFNRH